MAIGLFETGLDIMEYLDSEEQDSVKEAIVYMLMDSTDMDVSEIYSLVFKDGDRITWH